MLLLKKFSNLNAGQNLARFNIFPSPTSLTPQDCFKSCIARKGWNVENLTPEKLDHVVITIHFAALTVEVNLTLPAVSFFYFS